MGTHEMLTTLAGPIGVVALSGPVDDEHLTRGLEILYANGAVTVLAPNIRSRDGYLAGNDEERLAGLEWVLDQGVHTVLITRGGYGSLRLQHNLPWERILKERIRFVGFSDVSWMLNALAVRGVVQVHGPMVAAGLAKPENFERLRKVLDDDLVGKSLFRFQSKNVVRGGRCSGLALGGNVSMLTACIGQAWEADLSGSVLFIEEVNEPWYRLDRLLTQLAGAGRLRGVNALISGSLHGCGPADGRREWWNEMMLEVAPPDAVVVSGLPFGHAARNDAFPLGVDVTVDTEKGRVLWR
ncbi:MAG: LD-carboxypeptidase [bacterium]|nr:LD-carboxypeptidase [bacterium]